jgi:hypothetical protein
MDLIANRDKGRESNITIVIDIVVASPCVTRSWSPTARSAGRVAREIRNYADIVIRYCVHYPAVPCSVERVAEAHEGVHASIHRPLRLWDQRYYLGIDAGGGMVPLAYIL